jgi:magnesium transporter
MRWRTPHKRRHRSLSAMAHRAAAPGAPPGALVADASAQPTSLSYFLYDGVRFEEQHGVTVEAIAGVKARQAQAVLWVHCVGLADTTSLEKLGALFAVDPLVLEDVATPQGRPKAEVSDDGIALLLRLPPSECGGPSDQVSLLMRAGTVLTFDEKPGDCFDPVRERLRKGGRLRALAACHLAYRLLDAVVDGYFPLLETEGEQLEALEEQLSDNRSQLPLQPIHALKRRLLGYRRAIWPLREIIGSLAREKHPLIAPDTRRYLRDTYDHVIELIDLVEIYRETATSVAELSLSLVSARMNDVMKFLAVISAIFMPLTFLAGVYGMNFHTDAGPYAMPELLHPLGYPAVLAVMGLIALALLAYFFWRGFIGKRGTTLDEE